MPGKVWDILHSLPASIMGIDTSIYEAAEIDGAGKLQRIFKITIPMVRPTMIILVLLAVGGIFRGNFDLFYNLIRTNGTLYDVTDVIDTFTFRALINNNDIGMAAASGFFPVRFMLCNRYFRKPFGFELR